MVIVNTGSWLWPLKQVYFPTEAELRKLTARLPYTEHLTIMTTDALINDNPNLIYKTTVVTTCINLQEDLAAIYGKMDQLCRRMIRKAEKTKDSLMTVKNVPAAYDDFLTLHNSFVRAKGIVDSLGLISKKQLMQSYAPVSDCWVIYHNSIPICSHLVIRDPDVKRVRLKFAASARLASREMGTLAGFMNRYLYWQEIQAYKAEGFRIYDFGGIGDRSDWLAVKQFKLSFGGYIEERNGYVCSGTLRMICSRALRGLGGIRARLSLSKRLQSLLPQSRRAAHRNDSRSDNVKRIE